MEKVEICITSHCNLSCKHCYQHFEKNIYELSFEKIREVIDYAVVHGAWQVILSGGEASLHPKFQQILELCIEKGLQVRIITNATEINTKLFEKLPTDKVSFLVSVDGDEKSHDARRGFGCYEKMMGNVSKLSGLGFAITANVTVTEENYKAIPKILNNPYFQKCSFMPVACAGAAEVNNLESCDPSYETVLRKLYAVDLNANPHGCKIFPDGFSVKYNGDVYPCSLARDYGIFKMGNLIKTPIADIVNSFESTPYYAEICAGNERANIDECNNCGNLSCLRGCRIRAYKFNGRTNSPDPFCCKLFAGKFDDISFSRLYWGTT